MKRKNRTAYSITFLFVLLFSLIIPIIASGGAVARATTSSVLDDLRRDKSFSILDYPVDNKDYSIKVIQIAESTSGSLYLYTYQPFLNSRIMYATEINMSLSESVDNTRLYKLSLVRAEDVFCKYLIQGVTASTEEVRYYNITSIFRAWDKDIDGESGSDNIKNKKYFTVGKLFKAETISGFVEYSCKNTDVIEIINPYVDYVSYGQQSGWDFIFGVTNWTDIHYIAFSTDKKIDTLKEADVTYTTQSYHYTGKDNKGYTYGEKSDPQYETLTGEKKIGIDGFEKYTWDSIYRSEDFIKTTELEDTAKTEVEKSEFVLVFLKTPFKEQEQWSFMQGHYKVLDGTKVSNVSILRLKFETDGIVYNLGALMDMQEGDDIAGNKPDSNAAGTDILKKLLAFFEKIADFFEKVFGKLKGLSWWKILLIVLGVIIGIGVIVAIIILVGKALIKLLLKGLWNLVMLPYHIMVATANKLKNRKTRRAKNV